MARKKPTKRQVEKATRELSKIKISKGFFITIVVIALIVAITLGVLYAMKPDVFRDIFGIKEPTPPAGKPVTPPVGNNSTAHMAGGPIEPNVAPVGGNMEVHFIDVGQGDSILIRFPDGQAILIDAGGSFAKTSNHPYIGKVSRKITDYIDRFGITRLYGVLLTHSDKDHSGYLDDVIEKYEVKNIFLPDFDGAKDGSDGKDKDANGNKRKPTPGAIPTKTCGDVYVAADSETYTSTDGNVYHANIIKNVDDVVNIETDAYKMLSYCRSAEYYDTVANGDAHMLNSVSPVTRLSYAGREMLFMGDGEGEPVGPGKNDVDGWWMAKNIKLDIDVLKVGHHGSAPSSSQAFLEYVDPEYAVISCGTDNDYGHPRSECINRLDNYRDLVPDDDANGITTYRTDRDGNIILTVTPSGEMSWETRKDTKVASISVNNAINWYCTKKESYALVA